MECRVGLNNDDAFGMLACGGVLIFDYRIIIINSSTSILIRRVTSAVKH
jgi:hypothetical protein